MQLAGLAASVLLLQWLEAGGRPEAVIPTWAAAHSLHLALRYAALRTLRFPYPNQKRAALLAGSHVGGGRVPSVAEGNEGEQILLPPWACRPRVAYGCTLAQALAGSSSGSSGSHAGMEAASAASIPLGELQQLYRDEQYMLTWHSGTAWVLLLEGAGPIDMLRAMWQAAWLERHCSGLEQADQQQQLAASLTALEEQWPDFATQAAAAGWQFERAVLPLGTTRLRVLPV